MARFQGATVLDHCRVRSTMPQGDGAEIKTDQGTFLARRVIVTAGA